MITIYPLLYTSGVSESVLPGISTILEAYLLTYHQQEVLSNPALVNNPNRKVNFKVDSRGRITGKLRESFIREAEEDAPDDIYEPNTRTKPQSGSATITPRDQSKAERDAWRDIQRRQMELDDKLNDIQNWEEEVKKREERIRQGRLDLKDQYLRTKQEINKMADLENEIKKLQDDEEKLYRRNKEEMERSRERREESKEERERQKLEFEKNRNEREQQLVDLRKRKEQAETEMKEIELKNKKKEEVENKIKKSSVKIEGVSSRTISLEPSTVMVALEMPNKQVRRELIGVKVVPMQISSDVKLSHLLTSDAHLSFIMRLAVVAGRNILKKAWTIFDKMIKAISIGPFKEYGGVTVTGDPRKDIILGRTGHQGETFVAIEKTTDFDEFILSDPMKIKKLFQLGWGNLIITDNVSKQAHFCMKKYRGICNTIPYVMMYETLKMSKSYENLEDIKKQTQSLFKTKPIRVDKVLSELKAIEKLNTYRSLREGK